MTLGYVNVQVVRVVVLSPPVLDVVWLKVLEEDALEVDSVVTGADDAVVTAVEVAVVVGISVLEVLSSLELEL